MEPLENRRVLIVDDLPSIHEAFRLTLGPPGKKGGLNELEKLLFEARPGSSATLSAFELTSAYQGQEGLELAHAALDREQPFGVAFVDMRMPPGWDGLRTIEELWKLDARLQVVICTAYADYA